MGIFYEKISLTNAKDDVRLDCGLLDEVRTLTLEAMPDTSARTTSPKGRGLIINEAIRQRLGLSIVGVVESSMADGSTALHNLTEAVEIRWKKALRGWDKLDRVAGQFKHKKTTFVGVTSGIVMYDSPASCHTARCPPIRSRRPSNVAAQALHSLCRPRRP
jgi:hypothetical protein